MSMSTDRIQQQRANINRSLGEVMEVLFKDSDKFKSSNSFVLNERTPERNMLRIFGDKRGVEINNAIFEPVVVNEAERYRFVNRMYNEVRTFEDSSGKQSKLTKEERALVQKIIEGRAEAEYVAGMEMSEAIKSAAENLNNGEKLADVAIEFSLGRNEKKAAEKYARWLKTQEILNSGRLDNGKIENAIKKYSEMFDLFYDAINDFLVAHGYEPIGFIKGYAPHIQPEDNQNLLNKAFKAMGINTDVSKLPASIAGLTGDYKPGKRWNPFFLQRTGDVTEYDIAKAFESYVDYMSDILYHTDDIMRVRSAVNYFRRTYAPDNIKETLNWAEELRYSSTDEKADFLRDNEVIKGTSALTPADIDKAMAEYIDKMYTDIKKTTKYSELVTYLDNYANILAAKQSAADRGWEYSFGRTALNFGNKLTRTFAKAQVAGNLSSALNQTAQFSLISSELGVRHTTAAIADIATGKLRRAAWAQESDFLTGKKGIDFLVTDVGEMIVKGMFKPAEFVDSLMSTIAVRGRYLKEISAGKTPKEAMRAADAYGRSVIGSRMKGSRPLAYEAKNPVSQMLHIFQLEAVNSWEHISRDMPRDIRRIEREHGRAVAQRAVAGIVVKMLLSAFLLNRLSEELYGGTPAPFDILGLAANFIASGQGLTTNEYISTLIDNGWEKITGERLFDTDNSKLNDGIFDWIAAAEDLGYNVSNEIPFLRNASGMLGLGDNTLPLPDIAGAVTGLKNALTPDEDGRLSLPEIADAAVKAVTEFIPGGRQAYKSIQGGKTLFRGGNYKGYGEDSRLQYPTEGTWQEALQAMMFGGSALAATKEYYASDFTGLSKAQTALYDSLVDGGANRTEMYNAIQEYRKINSNKDITSYERGLQERDLIRSLDISDTQKLELYQGMTGADSRAEKFRILMDADLTWDKVMDAYGKYAELDANNQMTAGAQATALAHWTDEQGFTKEQAASVKEQLKFFSHIPAEAERYASFTSAGLTAEDAHELTTALADLDTTTDLPKYRTIDAADLTEKEKIAAIGSIMGTDMKTDSGNPSQYAKMLSAVDSGLSVDEYLDLKEIDAVENYLKYYDAGMRSYTAQTLAEKMEKAKAKAGDDWKQKTLQYKAAVDAVSDSSDQLAALSVLMSDSEYLKVSTAQQNKVTPRQFVRMRELLDGIDQNDSITQDEAKQAIDKMSGVDTSQKAVLWQIQNKSWAAKNNPYSTSVGAKIREALQKAGGEPQGLSLPSLDD